jgi:putative redox protein
VDEKSKAVVQFAGNDFFIGISPSGHSLTMDMDGDRSVGPSPMELLMVALGGCTGVDVVSILQKQRLNVTSYKIEISCERRKEYPRSFSALYVHHIVAGKGLSEAAVDRAIRLSEEKYCSVAATLRPTAEIISSFEIVAAEDEVITAQ